MITKENLKELLLTHLNFTLQDEVCTKHFSSFDCVLQVDFKAEKLIYPIEKGFVVNENQTCNFSSPENFVVFECVHRLLNQGYHPQHIELEPRWKLGHSAKSGRADILVKNQQNEPLLIIECKTAGSEFTKAWKDTLEDGAQLLSYFQQERAIAFVCLYASGVENDEVKLYQQIISLKDNEKILSENSTLKSFAQANNVEELFKVWKETYQQESTQKGIFESNILPYHIGKNKYTLDIDTKVVDVSDKKRKYHDFRSILRKYNVSRRENAFEVLVNLFLCKIVDERYHQDDLKFYWKGIAYDNYYDLVDRLQALYHYGMKEFLKQDIVYISDQQIDDAFWAASRNATKDTIKAMFRQLKFFKGLDFEFIKVHNQKQFEKNAEILIEMIKMWQGLRLLSTGQNQFLGDMFEFFLDNGIKQSEGQFFTPVPICKFVVASLPLEQAIMNSNEPLKTIDYACGAGHFLNEYALSIAPLVEEHKQADITQYYKAIFGIEKEDRLAKVAKVSAFMYGQDDITIIENDALDQHDHIKSDSFDCLIANPPFAVEDFLLTLPDEVRKSYSLFETVNDTSNKNIQCFFLERAQQLLAPNGITGIIVPSSILNNSDNTHIKTREILLQSFDFISIVELGSGTFGKTGTNTVVLFMRRKAHNPTQARQFINRVNDFFDHWQKEKHNNSYPYHDLGIVEVYCQYLGIAFDAYQSLLQNEYNEVLFSHELFAEYQKAFDNSNVIKILKGQKQFKAKSEDEQTQELQKRLLEFVIAIEKDKLFYFMLAKANPVSVLVVKSPSDNKEQKSFLGYEWSGAKGSEGIKYTAGESVYDMVTPLYNPNNRNDETKINKLISDNFNGTSTSIPEALTEYVSRVHLVDMLDFSRVEFNKAISLNASKKVEIESQYPLAKLGDIQQLLKRGKSTKYGESSIQIIKSGQARGYQYFDFKEKYFTSTDFIVDERKLKKGDLLINSTGVGTAGRVTLFNLDGDYVVDSHITILRLTDTVLANYCLEVLATLIGFKTIEKMANGASGQIELTLETISNIKIPLPPIDIQQQIVDECQTVDNEVASAKASIAQAKSDIEQIMGSVHGANHQLVKLGDITTKIGSGATPTGGESAYKESGITLIRSMNVYDNEFNTKGLAFIDEEQAKKLNNVTVEENDILFNITGASVARCCIVPNEHLPARVNQHVAIIRLTSGILAKYVQKILVSETSKKVLLHDASGASTREAITKTMLEEFKIPLPTLAEQKNIVEKIEALETKITKAQAVIDASKARKEAVLRKYL